MKVFLIIIGSMLLQYNVFASSLSKDDASVIFLDFMEGSVEHELLPKAIQSDILELSEQTVSNLVGSVPEKKYGLWDRFVSWLNSFFVEPELQYFSSSECKYWDETHPYDSWDEDEGSNYYAKLKNESGEDIVIAYSYERKILSIMQPSYGKKSPFSTLIHFRDDGVYMLSSGDKGFIPGRFYPLNTEQISQIDQYPILMHLLSLSIIAPLHTRTWLLMGNEKKLGIMAPLVKGKSKVVCKPYKGCKVRNSEFIGTPNFYQDLDIVNLKRNDERFSDQQLAILKKSCELNSDDNYFEMLTEFYQESTSKCGLEFDVTVYKKGLLKELCESSLEQLGIDSF